MAITTENYGKRNLKKSVNCIQLNLQHSRVATDNLMAIIEEDKVDILLIQEPYIINNKIAGVSRKYRIFVSGEGRHRSAIVITNNSIDAILIEQLSDLDTVVIEVIYGNLKMIISSMYFDIEHPIDTDLEKIDKFLKFTKGEGVLIAMDSNSRSTTWYDTLTNSRGRTLEEYMISRQLHIMNEESDSTTFRSRRGASNIDITAVNNQLLTIFNEWRISEEESCSDHNIIKYVIGQDNCHKNEADFNEMRYIVKEGNHQKFQTNLLRLTSTEFNISSCKQNAEELDSILSTRISLETDIENSINKFEEVLKSACHQSFRIKGVSKAGMKSKSVPWWTKELTVMRKRTNALRRRYQRTKNNDELREQRKSQYFEEKARYQATLRKEKFNSWKDYCNMTSSANPWNAVYKLAAGKRCNNTSLTTLRRPDGSRTSSTSETVKYMLEYFTPEDNGQDTEYQKLVRTETEEPIYTANDKDFTLEEIRHAIECTEKRKAPGEDGITSEIFHLIFKSLPKSIVAMYNGCLQRGVFPKSWKRAIIIPIVKSGQEKNEDVSKFRPISLLNFGGKVLEKVLINRINHHVFSNNLINHNQYGFRPQRSTIDAVMALKNFIEESLQQSNIVVITSLDVKGAFDAAWWPSILQSLKQFGCPRNLYNLIKSYFNQRKATISTNSVRLERDVSKGCPQGSCCGPGLWNIQYNSLLNLDFMNRTKAIAFADDLIIAVKGETVSEAENFTNIEMRKITEWAKNNKICFNEDKSKTMLVSRRKRKEKKEVSVYLNNKRLEQVIKMKYLGIILDHKFRFSEHITYTAERCTKLIHSLSKSAKITWGLKHKALKTIYKGAILPLLLYGAPIWVDAMKYEHNRLKYTRVQRLINIKIAKAFRTTSNEALCILTGLTPIIIKTEEAAKLYIITKGQEDLGYSVDRDLEPQHWPHPAEVVKINEATEGTQHTLQIFTDGSKNDLGVGSGIAIFLGNELTRNLKIKLDKKCTNNQAEQLAIAKALEAIETIALPENSPRSAVIYTDSKITLDSLKNITNHKSLIEDIRNKVSLLSRNNWTVEFSWIKAHAGTYGNELADLLAKAAARNRDAVTCFTKLSKRTIQSELEEEGKTRWQNEWNQTTKAAVTRSFFPNVKDRLKLKFSTTPNLTTMLTGHGRTRDYFYRFKIMENPSCPCKNGDQTIDHLIYNCTLIQEQRETLQNAIKRTGHWPPTKHELTTKYWKAFRTFSNSIDFEQL